MMFKEYKKITVLKKQMLLSIDDTIFYMKGHYKKITRNKGNYQVGSI